MRILLDTDILLDVALRRAEFFKESAAVLEWAEREPGQAAVAWHTLSNVSYLVRPDARPFLRELLEFVEVADTGSDSARQALRFPMKDFEDALQAAAALQCKAAFIVTRNVGHYRHSPIPALAPSEFMRQLNDGQ